MNTLMKKHARVRNVRITEKQFQEYMRLKRAKEREDQMLREAGDMMRARALQFGREIHERFNSM